jgi:ADP-ribosylglycohydrolase
MISDDTEHTCFVAQATLSARGDPDEFERLLARSLRWWLVGVPAGVGLATLRACLRLWKGIPPARSGVFSAGNGPAMRSALLGVAYGDEPAILREHVLRSTRITHSDPKAFHGALAVALAAHRSSFHAAVAPADYLALVRTQLSDNGAADLLAVMEKATLSAAKGDPLSTFAASIGCGKGISGYIFHTVPCVVQAWLRHQDDYRAGMEEILAAGGDTDTTAAILGGITGAGVGRQGIPAEWLAGIAEWPRTVAWMTGIGECLASALDGDPAIRPPSLFVPGIAVRNVAFTTVVLVHALRRLAPPY